MSSNRTAIAGLTAPNTGSRAGTDIIPVYVNQPLSGVVRPPQPLVGFARVTLKPGRAKTVRGTFPAAALGETQGDIDASGPPTVQPSLYELQVDKNTTKPYAVDLSAQFTVQS